METSRLESRLLLCKDFLADLEFKTMLLDLLDDKYREHGVYIVNVSSWGFRAMYIGGEEKYYSWKEYHQLCGNA